MIPKEFISELIAHTDIVEVLSEHNVQLKQTGREEFKACCPFHSEKTPSFYVSRDKQVYNCFGCKAKGNVITFLQEYDKLSFTDAVETLAERLNLEVPREGRSQRDGRNTASYRTMYELMKDCADRYHRALKSPEGVAAMEYLSSRGITPETIERFNIGYAPDLWNFISNSGDLSNQTRAEQLLELGMIKKTADGRDHFYDMFRNRVMIPILDRRGRVIAFGGRVLDKELPKYMNSPEMAIFHKGKELFGLYQTIEWHKNNRLEINKLIVVEGYMDVIALAQYGVNYAVASLGTATTIDQLQLIFRHTKRLICCYDGDAAGHKAAWHALTLMLPIMNDSIDVSFAFLPPEHDPDSYVRENGKDKFEEYLDNAMPFDRYLFSYLVTHQVNKSNNAELADSALTLLAGMPDTLRLSTMISSLSKKVFMDPEKLLAQLKRKRTYNRGDIRSPVNEESAPFEITPVRRLIILAVQYPTCVQSNGKAIVDLVNQIIELNIDLKGFDVLVRLVEFILKHEKGCISAASIVEAYAGTKLEVWIRRMAEIELYSRASNIDPNNVSKDIIATLTRILVDDHQTKASSLRQLSMKRKLTEDELRELTEHLCFVMKYYGKPIIEGDAKSTDGRH